MMESSYAALRSGFGLVRGRSQLVAVEGPDAESFLQGLLSQDVAGMEPGEMRRSLLLSPQGKLRALLWVARDVGDRFNLITDRGEMVAADLDRFRIRVKAEVRSPRPILEAWGRASIDALARPDTNQALRADLGTAVRWFLPTGDAVALLSAGAVEVADPEAITAVRVEEGEPEMGRDIDEATIPQETGLEAVAVSFSKGCYLGQELVARIDSRGHVNRRLVGITVAGDASEGAALFYQGKQVGKLTSVVRSPGIGAIIGLAMLRREVVSDAKLDLEIEQAVAHIRPLVR